MKVTLTDRELREYLGAESPEFPKYTTQLINLANQNAQGTRPKVVGQMSDLIQKFPGKQIAKWEKWYLKRKPDTIAEATDKIMEMLDRLKETMNAIDRYIVEKWVRDLVIIKTFVGLRFQEAILEKVADLQRSSYRLTSPEEESRGIDGFVGDQPVSIKPLTYRSKRSLEEAIEVVIIYYSKVRNGIVIELEDALKR